MSTDRTVFCVNDNTSAEQNQAKNERLTAFFSAVWPNEQSTYFCSFDGYPKSWWNVQNIAPFVSANEDKNLYFGIAQTDQQGDKRQRASRKGPHANVIATLYGDFDAQDHDPHIAEVKALYKEEDRQAKKENRNPDYTELPQVDVTEGKAGAWQALLEAQTKAGPASAIIDSGGGYQAYWFFNQPLVMSTPEERQAARAMLASFCTLTGGDKGAKDLERVYRVPFSYNHKPHYLNGPLLVEIVKLDVTVSYSVDHFRSLTSKPKQLELTVQAPKATPAMGEQKKESKDTLDKLKALEAAHTEEENQKDIRLAAGYLARLNQARCDGYADWFNVGAALSHRFTGTAQENKAFALWDEWSKQSSKYDSTEANREKWDSINPTTNERNFGSLAYWASVDDPDGDTVNPLVTYKLDDAGHAESFMKVNPNTFLFVDEWGSLQWDGGMWAKRGADKKLFKMVQKHLTQRVFAARKAHDEGLITEERWELFPKRCTRSTARTNSITTQIKMSHELDRAPRDFDQYPMLLNVANGILDLATGTLIEHDPSFMFTSCVETAFNPNADIILIENWVNGLGLSVATVRFLQKAVGYSLTGSTREEVFFYIQGAKRSGKGTFMAMIKNLLGRRLASEISTKVLTKRGGDDQNFALAPLSACRVIIAQETNRYQKLKTNEIKNITGGDDIHCAFKGKTHFSYTPMFKIWMTSNYPPAPDDNTDEAFWESRLRYIKFNVSHLGAEDKDFKDKLIKSKEWLEAFLLWAQKGVEMWIEDGHLAPSIEMFDWKEAERDKQDHILQWIEEECDTSDSTCFASNEELYHSYKNWAESQGLPAKRQRQWSGELERKGYKRTRTSKRISGRPKTLRGFNGLKILPLVLKRQ